jgi:ArsR family transcriptional regulator
MAAPPAPRAERWELYRLLAEPARLRLLALAGEDELAVSELAELLDESQPNVSRHAAPLRQTGLLTVRRQGTWTLMRLAESAAADPVIADALRTGRALCERDGTLVRVADVVRARDRSTREFFARAKTGPAPAGAPGEFAAYLAALAPLLPERHVAVDVGTGDGRSLEVLAPLFERVIAVDRSEAQLAACRERMALRGFDNVTLVEGELDGVEINQAVSAAGGADVVLAARVLHHAPKPADMVKHLASLARPGGAVVVIDYEHHDDESLREQAADLWLGFERAELERFARAAGLETPTITHVPAPWCGTGLDRGVPWQVMVARTTRAATTTNDNPRESRRDAARSHSHRVAGAT